MRGAARGVAHFHAIVITDRAMGRPRTAVVTAAVLVLLATVQPWVRRRCLAAAARSSVWDVEA
jgi:hypothetical protein